MKITGPWLDHPSTQAVLHLLDTAGYQAFLVGGCVRNALLGVPVGDIDICTDARPETVMALAHAAGIRAIPTGIDHGTVTLVVDGIAHEVTTFRADIDTDGRHATVRFSDDIAEDAARRDFTMNALYARADGTVVDPLQGFPDLSNRRLRFVGDPAQRIHEDYLRILRFFRFSAWYGDPANGFDSDALNAIARSLGGLDSLSRERVGAEMIKLLAAPDPAPALAVMAQVGVLTQLLPGADARGIGPLVHMEDQLGCSPDALRRLAAIGPVDAAHLRLSRAQARQLAVLRDYIGADAGPGELGYRLGTDNARDVLMLRAALLEAPLDMGAMALVQRGAAARFPVTAADLMPDLSGPALGKQLAMLEKRWIESGFSLSRDALLRG